MNRAKTRLGTCLRSAHSQKSKARIAFGSALLFVAAQQATAATRFWVGGSSFWDIASNWSATSGGAGGAGQPAAGDTATISLGASTTISRDAVSPNYVAPVANVYMEGTGGAVVTLSQNASNLLISNFYLAYNANSIGQITQSGGLISATYFNASFLDSGVATVNLSGTGSFSVGSMSFSDWSNTRATFNQSGGTFIAANSVALATSQASSKATYNLSAGSFTASSLTVGAIGAATFNQTSGNATVGTFACGVGGVGSLLMNGGNFNSGAGVSTVGLNGLISGTNASGFWNQLGSLYINGGTVDITNISTGVDTSAGQILTVTNGGTFRTPNWSVTFGSYGMNVANGGLFDCAGALNIADSCYMTVNGGRVNAGTIAADTSHFFFYSGTVNLTGTTAVNVNSAGLLGANPYIYSNQTFLTAGPINVPTNGLLSIYGGTVSAGSFNLTGGSINFNNGTLQLTGSNFVVGSTGLFGDTVSLTAQQRLVTTGANQAVVNAGALLDMDGGTLTANGGIVNNGEILFTSPLSRIAGGALTNNSLVSGTGKVSSVLTNGAAGIVRAASSDHVTFTAAGNTNAGTIQLLGGIVDFSLNLTNNGRVTGRGTLFANTGLTNNATLLFSGGPTEVYGNVTQSAAGRVLVTGGSTSTFYGNVTNNAASVITVDPASVVTFLGTVTGGTVNGFGTQIYHAAGSFATVEGGGDAVVMPNGGLNATHIREASLTLLGPASISINGGVTGTSRLNTLTIDGATNAWNTKLNLNDNDLVIDYASTSPITTVANQIKTGYASGAWTGNGITSSLANSTKFAIGYGEASVVLGPSGGTFSGQVVDNTTLLIKYTYFGDANLDGKVDVADLGILATHWQQPGAWTGGDFDYTGNVDVGDLGKLATNWQQGVGSPLGPDSFALALAALGLPNVTIPEPTSLALVALSAATLLRRRRV